MSGKALRKALGGSNLYLIGMMGSGKSATGPILAKALNYSFVDSDKIIEDLIGLPIPKIFEEEGEEAFREVESKVLQSIGERHSLIVSTGGGSVIKNENWGIFHQGIVIWIDPTREVLLKRLRIEKNKRPLLINNLENTLDSIFAERKSLYLEADLRVSISDEPVEVVATKILKELPKILTSPEDLCE